MGPLYWRYVIVRDGGGCWTKGSVLNQQFYARVLRFGKPNQETIKHFRCTVVA